jgi:Ni,Fe-hydrogenase maturation factor
MNRNINKILIFGNPYLKDDNLAVKVGKKLGTEGYKVVFCSSPDDLLNHNLDSSVILDVAKGIDKLTLFDDIDSLEFSVIFSLHDFDLSYFLKLLKATGKLKKANIIGIPQGYSDKKAISELKELITRVFEHNF